MRLVIVLATLLLLAAIALAGNVYMWKDDSGNIRLGDKPPAGQQAEVQTFSGGDQDAAATPASQRIELFVTQTCPYCTMAIRHLKSRGVEFQVYDIGKDREAYARKQRLSNGYRGVPFAMIYGTPVLGFSAETYDRHLAQGQ